MNLVKQGIGLQSIKSFDGIIPKDFVQEFHTVDDMLFLRIFGYDQLLGMKATKKDKKSLSIDGFEVTRNFTVSTKDQIHALKKIVLAYTEESEQTETMQVDEEAKPQPKVKKLPVIVFATDKSIKLLSAATVPRFSLGETVYSEQRCTDDSQRFVSVKFSDDSTKLLVAQQGGLLKHMEISLSEDKHSATLKEISSMKFTSEVSSICVSKTCDLELAYVSLYEAPYYSLNIINLANETMTIVARMPISAVLELAQMKKFCQH
jgi:hypothetical protein